MSRLRNWNHNALHKDVEKRGKSKRILFANAQKIYILKMLSRLGNGGAIGNLVFFQASILPADKWRWKSALSSKIVNYIYSVVCVK